MKGTVVALRDQNFFPIMVAAGMHDFNWKEIIAKNSISLRLCWRQWDRRYAIHDSDPKMYHTDTHKKNVNSNIFLSAKLLTGKLLIR